MMSKSMSLRARALSEWNAAREKDWICDNTQNEKAHVASSGPAGPEGAKTYGKNAKKEDVGGNKENLFKKPFPPTSKAAIEDKDAVKKKTLYSLKINKSEKCMTTETPYHVNKMEDCMKKDDKKGQSQAEQEAVEIPLWKIVKYEPLKEKTERKEILTNGVFLKRHLKYEKEEQKYKRWDLQYDREEARIEKINEARKRMAEKRNKNAAGREKDPAIKLEEAKKAEHEVKMSIYPKAEDALEIRNLDDIPVSVFGCPLPIMEKREFELTWIPGKQKPKKNTKKVKLASP